MRKNPQPNSAVFAVTHDGRIRPATVRRVDEVGSIVFFESNIQDPIAPLHISSVFRSHKQAANYLLKRLQQQEKEIQTEIAALQARLTPRKSPAS